ncbi:MAG TPA: lysophospholipid acyltransferase family protein [Myxococcota bacterium]|nr:lysophospholipid acyltransferase family protein [Myxococcota bacterium]
MIGERAVSAAMWAAGVGWMCATMPPMTLLYRAVGAPRVDGLTRAFNRGQLLAALVRWRAEVDPGVRPDVPYMFVQNHVNVLDHVTMYNATPHFKQGIELESHFRIPLYGWFMKARGTIPVNRESRSDLVRLMRRAREEVAAGHSLLAFPEGTRTRDGRVGEFHSGLFHVARQVGLPIVPVAVTGMSEVLRTGEHRFRPLREVVVHVTAPIPTQGASRAGVERIARETRERIAAIVDRSLGVAP